MAITCSALRARFGLISNFGRLAAREELEGESSVSPSPRGAVCRIERPLALATLTTGSLVTIDAPQEWQNRP
jgi:hypothetical protein